MKTSCIHREIGFRIFEILAAGWTSNGVNQFPDADTNNVSVWIKDDVDEVLLNHKSRRNDSRKKTVRRSPRPGPASSDAMICRMN